LKVKSTFIAVECGSFKAKLILFARFYNITQHSIFAMELVQIALWD